MNRNTPTGNSKNRFSLLISAALWLLFAALMVCILVPIFSRIWKDNTQKHTEEECKLIADAVLEKFVVDNDRLRKYDDFMKLFYYDMNAMSGWGHVYGGTNEKELEIIYDWAEYNPEAIAVRKVDGYSVLTGDFSRKEFDKALEKAEKERYSYYYDVPIEEAEYKEFDGAMSLVGTSHITEMDGYIYVMSEFRSAEAIVISRFAYVKELADIANGVQSTSLPELEEGYVSDSRVDLVMVRCDDNSVVQATEGIAISEGDVLEDNFDEDARIKIGDEWYTGGVSETDEYRVYALVLESDFLSRNVVSPIFLAFIFVAVFLLTGLYAVFYRDDIRCRRVQHDILTGSAELMGEVLIEQVRLMFYITSVVASVLILLICLLCVVDSNRLWGDDVLEDVERYYELDSDNTEILTLFRNAFKQTTLHKMLYLIEESPERMTEDALADLSQAVDRKIFLLDKKGSVLVTSEEEYDFTGISDPDSPLYALSGMLDGKADNLSVTISDKESSNVVCWAARMKKRDGILITMDNGSQTISFSDYYANYHAPEGMTLFAVDTATGTILSCSNPKYSGKDIRNIGLGDAELKDGFAGDVMLGGRRTFVHTEVHGSRADLIASDLGHLFVEYLPVILATLAAGLLITILFLYIIYRIQKKEWADPLAGYTYVKGNEHSDRHTAVGRWLNPLIPFKNQSADSKFHSVMHILIAIILIVGYVLYQNSSTTGILGESLPYLLQRNWRVGLNIYAITYALLMNCTIIIIGLTLRMIVLYSGSKFGSRGETIARLFGSFITYIAVAGAFGYGLVFLGVNTTAIFASAGIVGLAISIGARDLISDVFAGIFIVFEGEFRTGDIVDINGYRGTVEEIGVRTTKVMSMENVKVFRNTQVSGAINMTQRYSIAEVRIDVSRGEPLEEIKKIFVDALPGIRKKISYDISEITLVGIDQMTANGLVFLFQTNCKETDRVFVERELRWEFDLLMEKEQIATSGAIGSASVRKVQN